MFSKVALFITAAFAASAVAGPISNSCNTGPVMCCNSLNAPGSVGATAALATLLDVVLNPITADVGAQCNPITGVGLGSGANCGTSPVCCEQNFFNQLVGVNCSPVNVGL